MVYYFHLTKAPGAAAALALFAGGVPHALVIDPGPDPGRSHRRVLGAEPGKYGPGQPAGGRKAGPGPYGAAGARVQDKRWQGWAAVLLVWGVRLPGEIGTGEFTSTNPYGSPEAVPKATTVVPMKASGVLEHCDIGAHLGRRLVPLWLTAGGFSLLLAAFIRL